MIRRLVSVGFLLLLATHASQATQQGETSSDLRSFDAQYDIRKAGVTIGKLTRSLERDGRNRYRFSSTAEASGLAAIFNSNETEEISAGQLSAQDVLPQQYDYVRKKGKKVKSDQLNFDSTRQLLIVNRRGTISERALSARGLDKLAYQLQLMLDLLGKRDSLSYTIELPTKVKTYNAETTGREELKTPAGTYMTTRVEQLTNGGGKRTTFWCADSLQFLPVKVVVSEDGSTTEILLASFQYSG